MKLVFRKDRPGKPGTDCLVQNMELGENVIRETIRTHEVKGRGDVRPSDHRRLYNSVALALGQILALSATFVAAGVLTSVSLTDPQVLLASRLLIPAWLLAAAVFGLYPGWGLGTAEELRRLTLALSGASGATLVVLFFAGVEPTVAGRLFAIIFPTGLILLPSVHEVVKSVLIRMGQYGQAVVIYGAGESGRRVARALKRDSGCGYRPIAFLDDHPGFWGAAIHGIPVLGDMNIVLPEARMAVLALSEPDPDYHHYMLGGTLSYYDDVIVIPNDESLPEAWDGVFRMDTIAGLHLTRRSFGRGARLAKRSMDLILVSATLPLWLPLLTALAAVVRAQSGRTPIVTYATCGMDGEEFDRYRFDAPESDFGDWLIFSGLVDLPEIFNVILGHMSIVGPRPLAPVAEPDLPHDEDDRSDAPRLRPGMTGTWRLSGDESEDFYIRNRSFWLDLVIVLRTIRPQSSFSGSSRNE